MGKLSFAIVGYGNIGKRHAEVIRNNHDCILLGVIDPEETPDLSLQVPGFSSIEEFHKSGLQPDVVCICTPNGLHSSHAIKFLEKGSHVVIEKPMALTKQQCWEVLEAAEKAERQVFVVKQNRYSPPAKWIKHVVDSGILGRIYIFQVNCYWNRDHRYYVPGGWRGTLELDGGVLFTQFSHFIDLIYWVFGNLKDFSGRFENLSHQVNTQFSDSGTISFKTEKGAIGVLNFSTSVWDKNLESSITVIAEKGSLKIGGQYMEKVEYCHVENYQMPVLETAPSPNQYKGFTGSAANHHLMIQNVVETLQGKTTSTTGGSEGMKVVEIIENMYNAK